MRSKAILAPCFLLASLQSCAPGSFEGEVVITSPGTQRYEEREPNDSAAGPDYLTTLYAGDSIEITGHVDDGCCDPFDGFAIDAGEALELHFELIAHDGWTDLDFCVYDPAADVFLACYESPGDVEYGSVALALPAELHLVVRSWSGSSNYSLFVDAYDLPGSYFAATALANPSGDWADYRQEAAAPPVRARLIELSAEGSGVPRVRGLMLREAR